MLVFLAIYLTTILWIEKNGCFSIWECAHEVISKTLYLNIFSTKLFTVDLIEDSKREITPTILLCIQSFGSE